MRARQFRKGKGKEAKRGYTGHALMENRSGRVVDAALTEAAGTAEPNSAVEMLAEQPSTHRITVGTDKLYYTIISPDRHRGRQRG
jgi:hypothetical protein